MRQYLLVNGILVEIHIDLDSKLYWLQGFIVSYHLYLDDILALRKDKKCRLVYLLKRDYSPDITEDEILVIKPDFID